MRKKNSMLNIFATLLASFSAIIFNLINQKVLVSVLGIEYSGINGLFTNILNMLSIAELGIGSTIVFKLYKPISDNNIEDIKSWMSFYKFCYCMIAVIILVIGLIICPFIPNIVGNSSISENIIILYLISLADVIVSYLLTYKRSLLYANQKNYIINLFHTVYLALMNILQILVLYVTKSYLIYVIVKVFCRIIESCLINLYVNKKYSYINEKAKSISKEERKDVISRVKAVFIQKVSYSVNKGIDNVLISTFLGISMTGYYNNYHTVIIAIARIIYWIMSSMTASVGNLLTENNAKKNLSIYKRINMINSFVTAIAITGFSCSIQPFICIWLGEQYLLPFYIVLVFDLYIYSDSIRRSITLFKDAAGICKEDKNMYIISVVINIVVSVVLCYFIGLSGVILGTTLCYLFLFIFSYPKYVFKPLFNENIIEYFKENGKYFIFISFSLVIATLLCEYIYIEKYIFRFITYALIACSITSIVFILFFHKTNEFKFYKELIQDKLLKRGKKLNERDK